MSVSTLAQDLQPKLSTHSIILTDPSSQEFKDHLIRWGEVNIQIPGAIILAATEEDVIIIVRITLRTSGLCSIHANYALNIKIGSTRSLTFDPIRAKGWRI